MLGRFNKIFGIQAGLEEEKSRFVERINQTAFPPIENLTYGPSYAEVFEQICYWLGTNGKERIAIHNQRNYSGARHIPRLRTLTDDDFLETLKVLGFCHAALRLSAREQDNLSEWIETALENATVHLGVSWADGMFYPSGAKELDENLIEEPLMWLTDFPAEKADYLKALTGYASNRLDDVIVNCYLAVEGIGRTILGNSRTLDNNREGLLKKVGLSQEWKALLNNFISYANEFKRHASDKRHDLNPIEVEGFLYMTGVILRMVILSTGQKARVKSEDGK
jgi:hypothetical protein